MISPPEVRRAQGDAAEERACRHLEGSGFTIVKRNFRTRGGEIDIVARKGDVLVFVEVRSREVPGFGTPEESVTPAKRRRIVGEVTEERLSVLRQADRIITEEFCCIFIGLAQAHDFAHSPHLGS